MALKRARWVVCGKNLRLGLGAGLLGKKDSLDVGENAALGNGHAVQKLVQLFVVADGELKVAGDHPLLLVVPGSVAGKLEDLCGQVLHDGRQVDASSASGPLGVVPSLQKAMDSSDGKLEACPHRLGDRLGLGLSSFSASRHVASTVALS